MEGKRKLLWNKSRNYIRGEKIIYILRSASIEREKRFPLQNTLLNCPVHRLATCLKIFVSAYLNAQSTTVEGPVFLEAPR
jgi:hypothetical protein